MRIPSPQRLYQQARTPSLFRNILLWQLLVVSLIQSALLLLAYYNAAGPLNGGLFQDETLLAIAAARLSALDTRPSAIKAIMSKLYTIDRQRSIDMREGDFSWQAWRADGALIARDPAKQAFDLVKPGTLTPDTRLDWDDWTIVGDWSEDKTTWIVVGYSRAYYQRATHRTLRGLASNIALEWLMIMIALWIATRLGLRPLTRLGQRIRQRARDDFTPLTGTHDPAELRPLVQAIDHHAHEVQTLRQAEHRFFADAAHELRTPLAVIGAQAHALVSEQNTTHKQRNIDALQRGIQRSADVLNNVLMLARIDALTEPPKRQAINLLECLRTRIEAHTLRAIEKGLDLGLNSQEPIYALANETMLVTALDNLIDNAIRYVPTGERITLSTHAQAGLAHIIIQDTGPGIPAADHERIFARFERGQNASTQSTGSGLGLAITREIAHLMVGKLTLIPTSQGAHFELTLAHLSP